jgi:hypothetical protein
LGHNAGTTEIEVLNWLYATVCLLKPARIVETGAADGIGTLALASACKANGFGMVHSIEIDPDLCRRGAELLDRHGVGGHATFHASDSIAFLRKTDLVFEFGWFDSLCQLRADEFEICLERNILRGPAAFHDTSPTRHKTILEADDRDAHAAYRAKLRRLARDPRLGGLFESALSRGIVAIWPKPGE